MGMILKAECKACGFSGEATFGLMIRDGGACYIPVLNLKTKQIESLNIYKKPYRENKTGIMHFGELRKFNKSRKPYADPDLSVNTDESLFTRASRNEHHDEYNFRMSAVKNRCPGCDEFEMEFVGCILCD